MRYSLPTTVEINGTEYAIRSDYRDILTIIEAFSDAELTDEDKAEVTLDIFYPAFREKQGPKLMDWQQDFPLIVAPVNRVLGTEVRAEKYVHWFTWLSAYSEIGDCTFAQVVAIRSKKAKGKKLDKSEQEFYRNNRDLVDFERKYTAEDEEIISSWI